MKKKIKRIIIILAVVILGISVLLSLLLASSNSFKQKPLGSKEEIVSKLQDQNDNFQSPPIVEDNKNENDFTYYNLVKHDFMENQGQGNQYCIEYPGFVYHQIADVPVRKGLRLQIKGTLIRDKPELADLDMTASITYLEVVWTLKSGRKLTSSSSATFKTKIDRTEVHHVEEYTYNSTVSIDDSIEEGDYVVDVHFRFRGQISDSLGWGTIAVERTCIFDTKGDPICESNLFIPLKIKFDPDWTDWVTMPWAVPSLKIYVFNYEYKKTKSLFIEPIYIPENLLTKEEWNEEKISNILKFRHDTHFYFKDDKCYKINSWKFIDGHFLEIDLQFFAPGNDFYDSKTIRLPIIFLNFDHFLEIGVSIENYELHNYVQEVPYVEYKINENWLQAFYIKGHVQEVKLEVTKRLGSEVKRYSKVLELIDKGIINILNYEKFLSNYKDNLEDDFESFISNNKLSVSTAEIFQNNFYSTFLDYKSVLRFLYYKPIHLWIKSPAVNDSEQLYFRDFDPIIKRSIKDWTLFSSDSIVNSNPFSIKDFSYEGSLASVRFKLSIGKGLKKDEDILNSYNESQNYAIKFQFMFQKKKFSQKEQVQYILDNGTILDRNFRIIQRNYFNYWKSEFGYVKVQYLDQENKGEVKILPVEFKNNDWYLKSSGERLKNVVEDFDPDNLQYIFNQGIQIILSTKKSSMISSQILTASTNNEELQIKSALDQDKVISRTSIGESKPSSYYFGIDEKGNLLKEGYFSSGCHNIVFDYNVPTSLPKKIHLLIGGDLPFPLDDIPNFKKKEIIENHSEAIPVIVLKENTQLDFLTEYFSKCEVARLETNDKWYINSVTPYLVMKSNTIFYHYNFLIDYSGLSKIILTDFSDQKHEYYFWVNQTSIDCTNISFNPSSRILEDSIRLPDLVFSSLIPLNFSSPFLNRVKVSKNEETNNLSSSNSPVDNLIPPEEKSLLTINDSIFKWKKFEWKPTEKGLYEISLYLTGKSLPVTKFQVYFLEDYVSVINDEKTYNEKTYVGLPLDQSQDIENPPEIDVPSVEILGVNYPKLLVKNISISFSYLWCCEYKDIDMNNWDFSKEGKYKIIIDSFLEGERKLDALVLHLKIDPQTRKKTGLWPLFGEGFPPDSKPFWRGEMDWNFGHFEDIDYSTWEFDTFRRRCLDEGLDNEQLHELYKYFKIEPNYELQEILCSPEPQKYFFVDAYKRLHKIQPEIFDEDKSFNKPPVKSLIQKIQQWSKLSTKNIMLIIILTGTTLLFIILLGVYWIIKHKKQRKVIGRQFE